MFDGQKEEADYKNMMNELQTKADEARIKGKPSTAKEYQEFKKMQYEYIEKLSEYVPKLLKNESFFEMAFKN